MPHKHNHINHGVDPELIRSYLAGELDNKAMHALERQAMDDPFLAEALEGYAEHTPDQQVHLNDLAGRLERRVEGKVEKHSQVVPFNYRWMAAAAILLLLGTGFLFFWNHNTGKQQIAKIEPGDSTITDTLQFYKQEEAVAWGNGIPEKHNLPAKSADSLAKTRQQAPMIATAERPMAAMMLRRNADSIHYAAPVGMDTLPGKMEDVTVVSTRILQGKVKDLNNDSGIPGVSVSVEGTSQGALTDSKGRFAIEVDSSKKDLHLVVAAVGYNVKKKNVHQKDNNLDIGIQENSSALSEVVITKAEKRAGVNAKNENVYQAPAPGDGYDSFREYLARHVKYPSSAAVTNVVGKVRISFRVMGDGTLADFKVVRKLQPDCDAEALRVVKEGPAWIPASDGKATRVQVDVPFAP
jgi:hypothetical protein